MKIKNLMWIFFLVISKLSLADCFNKAGSYYQIDPDYLRTIAWQESKFNPKASNRNKDGSFDLGFMQINSKTFNTIKNRFHYTNKIYQHYLKIKAGKSLK